MLTSKMNYCLAFFLLNLIVFLFLDGKINAGPKDKSALLKNEWIFEKVPFPKAVYSCHASTIVETPEGLVVAWFGGSAEGNSDVGIWLSRYEKDHWSIPVEVANGIISEDQPQIKKLINPKNHLQPNDYLPEQTKNKQIEKLSLPKRYPCWNPVLFSLQDKTLLLFFKIGPSPSRWWGMMQISKDNGKTWGKSIRLPDSILGPIKNKPIYLSNGTIICPSSTEGISPPPSWQIHFEQSSDSGKTWKKIRVPVSAKTPAAIQPSILQLADGKLEAIGRTRSAGKLFATYSENNGLRWSEPVLLDLPNPNSGTDATTLANGDHLLVYNHTNRGRSPLNLALSKDGQSWSAALILEQEPNAEFSYPAIIQTKDRLVHIVYTWKRQRIRHVVIDPLLLSTKPMQNGKWPAEKKK